MRRTNSTPPTNLGGTVEQVWPRGERLPKIINCSSDFHLHAAGAWTSLGAKPGMAVGAALAIRDRHPDRMTVSVLRDGDYLMGASALRTAAAERIPLLIIIANNRAYYNDVVHQERMAKQRGRPVKNKWIGHRIDQPAPDLAAMARSLGAESAGPVSEIAELRGALEHALARVKAGAVYVLDVHVAGGSGKE